jgi:hypothetical protein
LGKREVIFGIGIEQGDQIGRIFADWAIVYFVYFFEKYISSQNLCATFFHFQSYVLIVTKKDWATFWAIFS